MKTNTYYKTLNDTVGKTTDVAYLNAYLGNTFLSDQDLTLCKLEFTNGKEEWWLSNQLVEVEPPQN